MVRKGEKSSAYFLLSDLPDLGCYHIPGAWTGLGPTAELGVADTAWQGPLVWPFSRSTLSYILAGTRVPRGIKAPGDLKARFS